MKRLWSLLGLCLLLVVTAFDYNGNENIVPSKLADFTVYSKTDHIKVTWVTHARSDIQSFDIQRSKDGKAFESMKKLDDQGAQPGTMEFFEVDNEPMPGWSYYRIAQVLESGDTAFSGIAPVFFGLERMRKGEYIAAKNPLDDVVPVNIESFNNEQVLLVLRDAGGTEYYVNQFLEVKGGKLRIPSGTDVPQGIYVITASSKDELVGLEIFAD